MELNVSIASPSILALLNYDEVPVQFHSAYSRDKKVQPILLFFLRKWVGREGDQVIFSVVSESVHYMG